MYVKGLREEPRGSVESKEPPTEPRVRVERLERRGVDYIGLSAIAVIVRSLYAPYSDKALPIPAENADVRQAGVNEQRTE